MNNCFHSSGKIFEWLKNRFTKGIPNRRHQRNKYLQIGKIETFYCDEIEPAYRTGRHDVAVKQ